MTDYPEDLLPWQENVIKKFQGRGTVQLTGRHAGKSYNLQAMQRLMDDLTHRPLEQLVCSNGTVFGRHYLTVEPIGGNWLEMESWCTSTFGPPASVWDAFKENDKPGRWYINDRRFWFLEETDKTLFVLKWR